MLGYKWQRIVISVILFFDESEKEKKKNDSIATSYELHRPSGFMVK